jgi:hypothetical protein
MKLGTRLAQTFTKPDFPDPEEQLDARARLKLALGNVGRSLLLPAAGLVTGVQYARGEARAQVPVAPLFGALDIVACTATGALLTPLVLAYALGQAGSAFVALLKTPPAAALGSVHGANELHRR